MCSHQAHVVQHEGIDASRHVQSVMGPECSNNHKGSELCIITNSHPLTTPQSTQYSTICIHACFDVQRLVSAAWYASRYIIPPYLYTQVCSHQEHVVQHKGIDASRHAQSIMGPEVVGEFLAVAHQRVIVCWC